MDAVEIGRLAYLLSVSYHTLKREIARGNLDGERVRRQVFIRLLGEYRWKNSIFVPKAALAKYLGERGYTGEIPEELDAESYRGPSALATKKVRT